jgi:hypothetical protein
MKNMAWIFAFLGFLVFIFIIELITGCTVVKTSFSGDKTKAPTVSTVFYYLPQSVITIRATAKIEVIYKSDSTLTDSSKPVEIAFSTTSEMIPDTRDLLSVNYKPNILMADDVKFVVSPNGLLETVNITTEDRTPDILSKLSEVPKFFLGTSKSETKGEGLIIKIKEVTSDFIINASDIPNKRDSAKKIKWNAIIQNELANSEDFRILAMDFSIYSSDIDKPIPELSDLIKDTSSKNPNEVSGILTRPLKNIKLNFLIDRQHFSIDEEIKAYSTIADFGRIVTVPIKRTAFVKKVSAIEIKNGVIISHSINKPSSVEGFITIPINILKAIVSIPAELVQFKIDNTKGLSELEKAKLDYEKSIQDSQKFNMSKESELEKVSLEIEKSKLSKNDELEKLKLELQKSLIEAKENQLKAERDLAALKDEIDKINKK